MTIDEKLQHFMDVTTEKVNAENAKQMQEYEQGLEKVYEDYKETALRKSELALKLKEESLKKQMNADNPSKYTSRAFHHKLEQAGMTQSMSRVAHCTDNGPMEGFWGILKREMYYKKKFHSREELVSAIVEYIDYYRNDRPQRGLGILTPMEYHDMLMAA